MRSSYDMGGGEEHMSARYSQNKVFKIAPKQTVYSALSISENFEFQEFRWSEMPA